MPPRVQPSTRLPPNVLHEISGVRPWVDALNDGHFDPRVEKDYERRHKMYKGVIDEFYIRDKYGDVIEPSSSFEQSMRETGMRSWDYATLMNSMDNDQLKKISVDIRRNVPIMDSFFKHVSHDLNHARGNPYRFKHGDVTQFDSSEIEATPAGPEMSEIEKSYVRNLQREARIARGEPLGSLEDSGDSPDGAEDSYEPPPVSPDEERGIIELRRAARRARGEALGSLEDSDSKDGEDEDSLEREAERAALEE